MGLFFTFNQIDTRPAIREQTSAILDSAKIISDATDRLSVATEAAGHREVVCVVETLTIDKDGNVLTPEGFIKYLRRLCAEIPEFDRLMKTTNCYDLSGVHEFLRKRRLIYEFNVHHFWNVVVGLQSRRHAHRCAPDGMARIVDFDPNYWR